VLKTVIKAMEAGLHRAGINPAPPTGKDFDPPR
jgi:hypothetical protein